MALYSKFETETSYKYLQQIINILDEPVCLLGGWAVYLTVNDNFKKDQGRNYLGSRDIDLGFYINKNIDKSQLKNTTIAKSLSLLKKEGFKPLGFRYYKEIHYETGKELTPEEAKQIPTHSIFTMYIDPIVAEIHPSFRNVFGFLPVDEPLLIPVFKDKRYRKKLKKFNKILWIPTSEILLATKIKSIPNRTQDEKLIKDICDIYVLSWYSDKTFQKIKKASRNHLTTKDYIELQKRLELDGGLFQKAQIAMDIDAETIKNLFEDLISK
jgi:hypothetical protein